MEDYKLEDFEEEYDELSLNWSNILDEETIDDLKDHFGEVGVEAEMEALVLERGLVEILADEISDSYVEVDEPVSLAESIDKEILVDFVRAMFNEAGREEVSDP